MLMEHQQPWFDVLTTHSPHCPTSGAVRVWIPTPAGFGNGYTVACAIKHLYDLGATQRVLYVTDVPRVCTARELSDVNLPNRVLANKPWEYAPQYGVDVVSAVAMYAGHDTWIKYGGYDLIVLGLHRNPLLGTQRQRDAATTVLGMDTKVWMVGCGV